MTLTTRQSGGIDGELSSVHAPRWQTTVKAR